MHWPVGRCVGDIHEERLVLVPFLSYALGGWMIGWASAPYDPRWALRFPKKAAWMAMAGPASNLLLVVIAAILIRVGMFLGYFDAPASLTFSQVTAAATQGSVPQMLATLISIMFSLNLLLFLFNLLPFPPLDGSNIPLFFLSNENAEKYSDLLRNPAFAIIGFVIAWRLFAVVYPPVHLFAINLLYPGLHYS
jgi:Zn-dependent protease